MAVLNKFKNYFDYKLLGILLLGFMSGIPFLLTLSTLSFRLVEQGISKTLIGLFIFTTLPYSLKFLWSPFLDFYSIPYLSRKLGKRKSWILLSQLGLSLSILMLGACDPQNYLWGTALSSLCVSFFAATQDSMIDAYRIEIIKKSQQGLGASFESIGFRLGMLISGAGALYVAAQYNWFTSYAIMGSIIFVGMISTLFLPKESPLKLVQHLKRDAFVWNAFKTFPITVFSYLIIFIFSFKLGDTILNAMSAPFLSDLGFTKVEYAYITKIIGIAFMVFGGIAGGIIIDFIGLKPAVFMCAFIQAISCLMFLIQSYVGYEIKVLMITISVESFCSGLSATAFIAYLSSFCDKPMYTATHFTWLYSIGSLARIFISAISGAIADMWGWRFLFFFSTFAVFPTAWAIYKISMNENTTNKENEKAITYSSS